MKTSYILYFVVLLLGISVLSCVDDDNGKVFIGDADLSISDYLKKDSERFSMWYDLIEAAGIAPAMSSYNPYGNRFTMFAPTNEGMERFLAENSVYNTFGELLADTTFIKAVARYHVLNKEVRSVDFSFGALPDTTATGDYIIISFEADLTSDSTKIIVNSRALVVEPDIDQSNGYIHAIDNMLEPNVYSAYEWIENEKDGILSIFYKALVETGLKDSMNIFLDESIGLRNRMTVWVETDEVFNARGIMSYEDLVEKYDNTGNVKDENNNLRLFMSYHLMKQAYYLNDFQEDESQNFETYANLPLRVTNDLEIKLNVGGDDLDSVFVGNDTITRNYITINYAKSNIATLNGPIHFIEDVLEREEIGHGNISWHFRDNEPILENAWSTYSNSGNYAEEFVDLEDFVNLKFKGISSLIYSTSRRDNFWDRDWIRLDGDFTMDFYTTKVLPGKYTLRILTVRKSPANSVVQFYWNDFRMGAPVDCSRGQTGNAAYVDLGEIEVSRYERQKLTIDAVRSGTFIIYYVQLIAI